MGFSSQHISRICCVITTYLSFPTCKVGADDGTYLIGDYEDHLR